MCTRRVFSWIDLIFWKFVFDLIDTFYNPLLILSMYTLSRLAYVTSVTTLHLSPSLRLFTRFSRTLPYHPLLHPISMSLSLLKCPACIGLVSTFAYMSSVPRCVTTAIPAQICSYIQQYSISVCRVFSAPDLPLSINAILDLLS
jgi:hypothetical protein